MTDSVDDATLDRLGNLYLACVCTVGRPEPVEIPGAPPGAQLARVSQALLKFGSEGDLLWNRQVLPGLVYSQAIATDPSGNVLLAGTTIEDTSTTAFLFKLDSAGARAWSTTFPGHISDVTSDGRGNVYVAGELQMEPTVQAGLRRYSPDGKVTWTVLLDADINGLALRLIVDTDDRLYLAGTVLSGSLPSEVNAGGTDLFLQSYTPLGDEVWVRQFGSAEDDYIADAAVDGGGNIYVASTNSHPVLRKFESSGSQEWARELDIRESRSPVIELAVNLDGNLYLLLNPNWPGLPSDAEVRKLDAAGQQVWVRLVPPHWPASPELIVVDSNGNVYLAGGTFGALPGQTDFGNVDVFLLRLRP